MTPRRAVWVVVLALSAIEACKQPPAPTQPASSTTPSETEPAPSATASSQGAAVSPTSSVFGCEIRSALVPDRAAIVVGEPVYLTVRLSTICPQAIAVLDGGDYRNRFGRADSFEVRVTDEGGKELPVIDAGPGFGGLVGPRELAAGKVFEKRLLLGHWVRFDAPGRYQISVRKPLRVGQAMTPSEADKIVLPLAVTTTLDVAAASPEALGAVITRLATGLASAEDGTPEESLAALVTMHDARIVPHFVRLVSGPPSLRPGGLTGLSAYATDEALAGLVAGLGVSGMHLIATQALATSVHPKAWARLWELRADPDTNVRLTVLHALAKRDEPGVLEKITAFRSDPAEIIAKEAARYEAERKARR